MRKRKSKKINKMRGRRAAGYGFSAGHRASGQRGGKGMAGSKKHHYIKVMQEDPRYFGKHGFKRPQQLVEETKIVNVRDLDETIDELVEKGLAEKKGKTYTVDMTRLDFDKILGSGQITKKINLIGVKSISRGAEEKITEAGGSVELLE
ncbi:MAG: 50S ribosomal protein L15 [Candidatus Thorarchaeota archaeon]|nr:MAG: 50S ribosomal protein L15 [Candidatus Thorarchaeota archaeon]